MLRSFKIVIFLLICFKGNSQEVSVSIGTDIPYQHHIGLNLETQSVDLSFRTGILVPPYSEAILSVIKGFGINETYSELLESAFNFGWMNSIGAYYKFGNQKTWYAGLELRLDHLTAADTPRDLVETVIDETIVDANAISRSNTLELGLFMTGIGFRLGKSFAISADHRHFIKTEISFNKYVSTKSSLEGNIRELNRINNDLDELLWTEVFDPYGFIGGIGVVYTFKF